MRLCQDADAADGVEMSDWALIDSRFVVEKKRWILWSESLEIDRG